MYESVIPVDMILTKYFVKYDRLDKIIPDAFKDYNATELNLYIDLYGLYKTLYSRTYRTDVSDYTAFTSGIINMCIHYRSYFKFLKVKTNIFLVSSMNIPKPCTDIIPGYNHLALDKIKNSAKEVDDMIRLNNELLEIICPYLPDIYFFKTQFESTVMINELYNRQNAINPNTANIIISSDLYPIQLIPMHSNLAFMRPRKYRGIDNSLITSLSPSTFEYSFWYIIAQQRGSSASYDKLAMVSPSNFSILQSLNRFPERNINALRNITEATRLLSKSVYRNTKVLPETLFAFSGRELDEVTKDELQRRYNCIDYSYQYGIFKDSVECMTLHYENLNDPEAIRVINDKYFKLNPIDIFRL